MTTETATIERARRKPGRWLRFSLRTMLIAVALFGIWLGIRCRNASRQKQAVAVIRSGGGRIAYLSGVYDFPFIENPPPPRGLGWLRDFTGIDFFETVGLVDFIEGSRGSLEVVDDLPNLINVTAAQIEIPDRVMDHIGRLPLRFLFLFNCGVSRAGWRSLKGLDRLQVLCLEGSNVDDMALSYVTADRTLHNLTLSRTQITDAGLASLRQFTGLKEVSLEENPRITTRGAAELIRALPNAKITVKPVALGR